MAAVTYCPFSVVTALQLHMAVDMSDQTMTLVLPRPSFMESVTALAWNSALTSEFCAYNLSLSKEICCFFKTTKHGILSYSKYPCAQPKN